jgi:DNA topoisomerase-3
VHTVMTEVEKEAFKTIVKQLLDLGWKVIYADQTKETAKKTKGKDEEEELEEEISTAFSVDPNIAVHCIDAIAKEKETQPPKHYNEGTLLKAMESAGKQVEDEELRDAMKDSGLGTPATRAATIERLKQVEYIEMQGKKIQISPKGRKAIELIRSAGVELLTSPEMTGHWERRLNEISKGIASDAAFMENVKKFTTLIIDKVRAQPRAAKEAFARPEAPAKPTKKPSRTADDKAITKKPATGTSTTAVKKPTAPLSRESIANCPREGCIGHIFMGNKGYGCSSYKEGCKFVIWKESFGKTISPAMVKMIIEKGRTNKLKLTDEAGQAIEARIALSNAATGELKKEHM